MRSILLVFLFPLFAFGQSQLMPTHWAVHFNSSLTEEERADILKQCGVALDEVEHFSGHAISFVPMANAEQQNLIQHKAVSNVTALFSRADGQFVTHLPSFFVQLHQGQEIHAVEQLAERTGVRVAKADPLLNGLVKLEASKFGTSAAAAEEIFRSSGLFAFVGPNLMHTVTDCSVDDPLFIRQWNLKNDGTPAQGNGIAGADMNLEAAWEITTGNANIKIAILDSGVDTLHPELLGKLMPGFDAMALPDSASTHGYPTPTYSQDGHGTACAGIAAASGNNGIGIAGVCRDCSVIPIRVFSYQNLLGEIQPFSNTESFIRGINWQWQIGNADVSSNSWGVPDFLLAFFPGGDSLVNLAIDAATSQGRDGKGLPMLFSSGNDGVTDSIPIWPARYEKTIAVGASSMCDEWKSTESCDNENWAGNWGPGLDCAAPGVRVPTTDMLGSNGYNNSSYYNTFNGTSAACPNAAGVMGLLLSSDPELSRLNATRHLINGCEKVGGYDYNIWNEHGHWSNEMGYGRVNAHLALVSVATVGVEESEEAANAPLVKNLNGSHEIVLKETSNVRWRVVDINGRTVREGHAFDTNTISIDHSGMAAGIYILRLQNTQGAFSIKLTLSGI